MWLAAAAIQSTVSRSSWASDLAAFMQAWLFAQPVVPMAPTLVAQLDDHGAGTVGVVGGPLSQLLEQNYAILNQFKQNMEVYKVNENTELLVRFRGQHSDRPQPDECHAGKSAHCPAFQLSFDWWQWLDLAQHMHFGALYR